MKFLKNLTFLFLFTLLSVFPVITLAVCPDNPLDCTDSGTLPSTGSGTLPSTGSGTLPSTGSGTKTTTVTVVTINNPLGDNGVDSIPAFIKKITEFATLIAIPILTLAIIYCGFLFVSAQGNSEKLGDAKKALLYTLIGAAILLGANLIASVITNTVSEFGTTAMLFINNFMV